MKNKYLIIAGIVLLAIAAFYFTMPDLAIWKQLGLKKDSPDSNSAGKSTANLQAVTKPVSITPSTATVQDAQGWPLMEGKSGYGGNPSAAVREVQKRLNSYYGSRLTEDGIYGPLTRRALSAHNLPVTITWNDYLDILGLNE